MENLAEVTLAPEDNWYFSTKSFIVEYIKSVYGNMLVLAAHALHTSINSGSSYFLSIGGNR